jgi:hypothetical protein
MRFLWGKFQNPFWSGCYYALMERLPGQVLTITNYQTLAPSYFMQPRCSHVALTLKFQILPNPGDIIFDVVLLVEIFHHSQ